MAALAVTAIFLSAPWPASEAAANPFDVLLGSWGGSGQIAMTDGRSKSA